MSDEISSSERLIALLDHLGLVRAHVATQFPGDIGGLAVEHPDRLGGIVLCAPLSAAVRCRHSGVFCVL